MFNAQGFCRAVLVQAGVACAVVSILSVVQAYVGWAVVKVQVFVEQLLSVQVLVQQLLTVVQLSSHLSVGAVVVRS